MNLTPATLRLDLKCGKGAISEGEKCTKGPATKVEPKSTSGSHAKGKLSVAEIRKAPASLKQGGLTTGQKVILGAYALAGASTLYQLRNQRQAYEEKFSPAQRFKPFTEDIGGIKNVLQTMVVKRDKTAGPSLFGDVTFGTYNSKDVVAKKIGNKGPVGSAQIRLMEMNKQISEKTADALVAAQKNLQVNEVQAAQLAGKHGFGPKFVAAGNNTLITEAARGRPLASQDRAMRYMQGKGQQELQQDPGRFFKKALALQWRGFTKGTELSSTNKARIVENLGRMHTLGISHNDLHPGNVFISSKGAEFIDFGTSDRGGGAVASEFVRLMNKPRAGLQQVGGMGYNLRTVNPAAYRSAESAIKKTIGKRVGTLTSADIQNALKKSKNSTTLESSLQRIVDDYYLQLARGQRTDAEGVPCGESHIPRGHTCHKRGLSPTGKAVAAGLTAGVIGAAFLHKGSRKAILGSPTALRRTAQRATTEVVHRVTAPKPSMRFRGEALSNMRPPSKTERLRTAAKTANQEAERAIAKAAQSEIERATAVGGAMYKAGKATRASLRSGMRTHNLTVEKLRRRYEPGYRKPRRDNYIQHYAPVQLQPPLRRDACWEGYVQAGMKRKGKREVPNCVPASSGLGKPRTQRDTEDGKKYAKTVTNPETGRQNTVRYGAKGYTIAPGTDKGDRYCARSFGDMKSEGYNCAGAERNTPLCLSRAKWKCSGKSSRRS